MSAHRAQNRLDEAEPQAGAVASRRMREHWFSAPSEHEDVHSFAVVYAGEVHERASGQTGGPLREESVGRWCGRGLERNPGGGGVACVGEQLGSQELHPVVVHSNFWQARGNAHSAADAVQRPLHPPQSVLQHISGRCSGPGTLENVG